MKRKIITLLLAVSASCVFSATAMAEDADKANGFYDIEANQKVELTVMSGDAEASVTEKDVDGDEVLDKWYKDSNRIGVVCSETTDGAYYSILLVDGRGLPTKDTEIYYLNQETATGDNIEFDIKPILPEDTTDLSIYIFSNAEDFQLVTVPLSYAVDVESYKPGDVDGNGKVEVLDITLTRRFITGGWGVVINDKAADVDADNDHTARDVILMRRYVAGGYNVELK